MGNAERGIELDPLVCLQFLSKEACGVSHKGAASENKIAIVRLDLCPLTIAKMCHLQKTIHYGRSRPGMRGAYKSQGFVVVHDIIKAPMLDTLSDVDQGISCALRDDLCSI